jgi:RNA-directed DNA polymerase
VDGPGTWAGAKLVRYADDFVVLARRLDVRIVEWIESTLEGRFRLTINREKTRVVRMPQPQASLDFLGFTFRYERDLHGRARRYLRVEPSRKAEQRLRDRVRERTDRRWNWMPLGDLVDGLNLILRGWQAYFRHGHPSRVFHRLNGYVQTRLWRHLRRRSQRRYRLPKDESLYAHMQRFGLHILTGSRLPAHASR